MALWLSLSPEAWGEIRGVPIGRVVTYGGRVESWTGTNWEAVTEGFLLRTGAMLRTDAESMLRVEMPWTVLVVSSSSLFSIPPSTILSIQLLQGRVEQLTREGNIVKISTDEALVRGAAGRVVVRRLGQTTWVSALAGTFGVSGSGGAVALRVGQGTEVASGQKPSDPAALPAAPRELAPGANPAYVLRDQALSLRWTSGAERHLLQVSVVDTDEIVVAREVGRSPATLRIPWLGTFRWRVAASDQQSAEGMPSAAGLICVVEE